MRGDVGVKVDDSDDRNELVDPGSSPGCPLRTTREGYSREQLRVYDGRHRNSFLTHVGQRVAEIFAGALQRDERTGVNYESHGLVGGVSAEAMRSRSSSIRAVNA